MPPCYAHYIAARDPSALRLEGCHFACNLLGVGLLAAKDHYGIGDHLSALTRTLGDLDGVAVACLHLVGAELHPEASVPALVYLGPLHTCGGAHPEAGGGAVACSRRPASVDGIGSGSGHLQLEPCGTVFRRCGVCVVVAVLTDPGALGPPRRVEASRRGVVHDLRLSRRGAIGDLDVRAIDDAPLRDRP